eukprot:351086-Chlamydomonas_euryale.AAC.5
MIFLGICSVASLDVDVVAGWPSDWSLPRGLCLPQTTEVLFTFDDMRSSFSMCKSMRRLHKLGG